MRTTVGRLPWYGACLGSKTTSRFGKEASHRFHEPSLTFGRWKKTLLKRAPRWLTCRSAPMSMGPFRARCCSTSFSNCCASGVPKPCGGWKGPTSCATGFAVLLPKEDVAPVPAALPPPRPRPRGSRLSVRGAAPPPALAPLGSGRPSTGKETQDLLRSKRGLVSKPQASSHFLKLPSFFLPGLYGVLGSDRTVALKRPAKTAASSCTSQGRRARKA
mmetsp:Transcript_59821/g.165440  ORF Transcript_59821/g.165440 Transcript_59821/m.165440 type:complete len:217 (+) Transcript_59821:128-778(+)